MSIERILEPEVMDTPEEARDYNAMDHSTVNKVFVDDFLLSATPDAIETDILDLGTGTALIPVELCERDDECRVMAVDASIEMLEIARFNIDKSGMLQRIDLQKSRRQGIRLLQRDVSRSHLKQHHSSHPGTWGLLVRSRSCHEKRRPPVLPRFAATRERTTIEGTRGNLHWQRKRTRSEIVWRVAARGADRGGSSRPSRGTRLRSRDRCPNNRPTLDLVDRPQRVIQTSPKKMKQIMAIVKPFIAEKVIKALGEQGHTDITIRQVHGYGRQKSYLSEYQQNEYSIVFVPKVEICVWSEDVDAENVIQIVTQQARTGRMGDGKVFCVDVINTVIPSEDQV